MTPAIVAAIVLVTVALYLPAREFEFLHYDDHEYVTENEQVKKGLTLAGVRWALTAAHADNWHPATWISHMADVQLFGLAPGPPHLVNVGFHIANAVLLFAILAGATGAAWRSAAVSLLFAVHPLHVESVAWISERKDVLSTFFMLLTTIAYLGWLRRRKPWRYALMSLLYGVALTAKAMVVTLPFALLLLDYWPLRRWDRASRYPAAHREGSRLSTLYRLTREKGVLIALAAAVSVITFFVQLRGGAVAPLDTFPVTARLANALMSYARYVYHMVYPLHLMPSYVRFEESVASRVLAGLFLVAVSAFVLRRRERQPYLLTGWLWYLLTLVPVIGLVQVGGMAMADRYTYVPLIGLFIMASWGLTELAGLWRGGTAALLAGFLVLLPAGLVVARKQLGVWRNDRTLSAVTPAAVADEYGIYLDLGKKYATQGDPERAMKLYWSAIMSRPDAVEARNARADLLFSLGKVDEAQAEYATALRLDPDSLVAHLGLGNALVGKGQLDEALAHFRLAVRLSPAPATARNNVAVVLVRQGKTEEAIVHFRSGLEAEPENAEIHFNLGEALLSRGRAGEAVEHFAAAVRIKPEFSAAGKKLEEVREALGR